MASSRLLVPTLLRAAGRRLSAPARRPPVPSTFLAAVASRRPFSTSGEEIVLGVGKGKTSTGLVSCVYLFSLGLIRTLACLHGCQARR